MNRKLTAVILVILFLASIFSSNAFAEKNLESSQSQKVRITINNCDSSVELPLDEAEEVKNKLLDLENKYSGTEKIAKQLEIFHETGIITSEISPDFLYSLLDRLNKSHSPLFFFPRPHLDTGGPMIVSHFTIGGRICGIKTFKPWYYNETTYELKGLLNGSHLDQVVGVMPMYVGISFRPVFVTAIGFKILRSVKHIFFPFFEVLLGVAGTSIAFVYDTKNSQPITLFEYNLDICLAGLLGGL